MWGHHYGCDQNVRGERCKLNLWAPDTVFPQDVTDSAFSCFAKHQSELDEIVEEIAESEGMGVIDLDGYDEFTSDDLHYIENRLAKRGIICSLSLDS